MNCICGQPFEDAQKFCIECGTSVVVRCANGHLLEREQKYCIECGLHREDTDTRVAVQPQAPWTKSQMGFTTPFPLMDSSKTPIDEPRSERGWPQIFLVGATWALGAICSTFPLTQSSVSFVPTSIPLQLHWFLFGWLVWAAAMLLAVVSKKALFSAVGLLAGIGALYTLIDQLLSLRSNAMTMVTPQSAYFLLVLTVVAAIGGSFRQLIVGIVRRRRG